MLNTLTAFSVVRDGNLCGHCREPTRAYFIPHTLDRPFFDMGFHVSQDAVLLETPVLLATPCQSIAVFPSVLIAEEIRPPNIFSDSGEAMNLVRISSTRTLSGTPARAAIVRRRACTAGRKETRGRSGTFSSLFAVLLDRRDVLARAFEVSPFACPSPYWETNCSSPIAKISESLSRSAFLPPKNEERFEHAIELVR
jgi:hypothetical protein